MQSVQVERHYCGKTALIKLLRNLTVLKITIYDGISLVLCKNRTMHMHVLQSYGHSKDLLF